MTGSIPSQPIRIAVVGDVHNQWEPADAIALEQLGIDLVLFVGDFGNESIEVVEQIAALSLPKAIVFGNHDAWYSATSWGRDRCPYDRTVIDRVQQQIDLLGAAHVGYGKLDLPHLSLTVVGSRPFSWGGAEWKNKRFYRDRYAIESFEDSTERILSAVQQAGQETVIFLGHNGPQGLGAAAEDTCGRDWKPIGGDHGDPDFAEAIAKTRRLGKTIPLVTFGHMHHRLRHTSERLRQRIVKREDTIYLNAAAVPRIVETEEAGKLRNFSLVTLTDGVVSQVALVWVDQYFEVYGEEILYLPSLLTNW
jgi:uncharacterized protein (TIGR04168 family)